MKGFPKMASSNPINPGDYKLPGHLEYHDALRLNAGKMLEVKGFRRWYANEYKTNCLNPEDFEKLIAEVKKACPYVGYNTILEDLLDFVFVAHNNAMSDNTVLYSLEFNGRQLEPIDIELENEVAAINIAFKMLSEVEYPPEHGRDMTDCCSIYANHDGYRSFICNVNDEGEVYFDEQS